MKAGDKYVIEIEEVIRRNGAPQIARIKGFNTLVFDQYRLDKLEPYWDWEDVYRKGYEDGKNAVINESEKITTKDISDAYNKGLEDAWKLVRRIESEPDDGGLTNKQIEEVFGQYYAPHNLYNEFSADEALDLYRRWEDKQKQDAEIKVGDEVIDDEGEKGIVTKDVFICGTKKYTLVWYGTYTSSKCIERLTKTGRHFEQMAEVLAELRGEINEKSR